MPAEIIQFITIAALTVFSASLIYAAYTDIREMRITNKTCLVGIIAYVPYAAGLALNGNSFAVLIALGVAAAVFTATALMNAANALGGGDVKLLTVLALWTGSQYFLDTFFLVALLGGVVALLAYIKMTVAAPSAAGTAGEGQSAMDQRPIPYGPAISLAGLILSSELILNAFSS